MQASTVPALMAGHEQATSYRRLAARGIDAAVGVSVLLPLSAGVAVLVGQHADPSVTADVAGWVAVACLVTASIAYDAAMTHLFGRTLGKMALGLRVIDSHGARLAWGWSSLRAAVACATAVAAVFLTVASASILGWVLIRGISTYVRFPHDRVSKSFVVWDRRRGHERDRDVPPATDSASGRSAVADLDRLWKQGIISGEEYERKRREYGL